MWTCQLLIDLASPLWTLPMSIDDDIAMGLIHHGLLDNHLARNKGLGGICVHDTLATGRTNWLNSHSVAAKIPRNSNYR